GSFVIIAAGLLIATVFSLTGFFNRGDVPYRAFFKNAGGLRPGAEVRYAGGPPVGRIQEVRSDAHDTTRMEIIFRVKPDVPVKTDSTATITSNSQDRKSTRLNSSHVKISYAVFCLKKKKKQ